MVCGSGVLDVKLKEEGVVGWVVDASVLALERGAGWEKVNCGAFAGAPPLLVVRGLF